MILGDNMKIVKKGDNMKTVKKINIKKFRELGLLQEINRLILHPIGLALRVNQTDKGKETLDCVIDCRDDIEGICFMDLSGEDSKLKSEKVAELLLSKKDCREKIFGWHIQPIGSKLP
jgi:hypothetical protein